MRFGITDNDSRSEEPESDQMLRWLIPTRSVGLASAAAALFLHWRGYDSTIFVLPLGGAMLFKLTFKMTKLALEWRDDRFAERAKQAID